MERDRKRKFIGESALKRGWILRPKTNTFSAPNLPWRRRLVVQLLQQSDRLVNPLRWGREMLHGLLFLSEVPMSGTQ